MAVRAIEVDPEQRAQVRRFVQVPYGIYAHRAQWVPPLRAQESLYLDRRRHPFYQHSEAAFFVVERDGRDVGRVAALVNRPFNAHHKTSKAQFYLFECENDAAAAGALFERVFEWAGRRGLDVVFGPKGFSTLDGFGVLIEGFEQRQVMSLLTYNHDYYASLLESLGFSKEIDFVSARLRADSFVLPSWVRATAERVQRKCGLRVESFPSMRRLLRSAPEIVDAYDRAFEDNWEYWPLSEREKEFVVDSLRWVTLPRLIKIIREDERIVGFLFAFLDLSAALQRSRGSLWPWGFVDLWLEKRRTKSLALYGVGLLPEFQGQGGNALLFVEMERTVQDMGFETAEVSLIGETAVRMRQDFEALKIRPDKVHRVYARSL